MNNSDFTHENDSNVPDTNDNPAVPLRKEPITQALPEKAGETPHNSPIMAIFQWLTYAFWGWVAIATAALVAIVTHFSLNGYTSNYESVAYVIAATLVLLPIALICDIVFSKHEQDHKAGIAMVIMVIHAVLFALFGVGALAAVVFSLVSILLSDTGDLNSTLVVTATASVLVVVYGLLVLRTMKPSVKTKLRLIVRIILIAIVLGTIIWGIVGPVTQTFLRKNDERALQAVQTLDSLIIQYVASNGELPRDVAQATSGSDKTAYGESVDVVTSAVEDGLVSYTANTKPSTIEVDSLIAPDISMQTVHYYELCVTYQYADKNRSNVYYGGPYVTSEPDGYQQGLQGTSTEAGKHCYDLKTSAVNAADKPLL